MSRTPKLLVSVRDVEEAEAALGGGCDIIDVKEPERGPLGMADPETIAAIVQHVTGWNIERRAHVPTSVALGEVDDWEGRSAPVLPEVDFVKLGTAGIRRPNWTEGWRQAVTRAIAYGGGNPRKIIVAYADWQMAEAPPVSTVISSARDLGCAGVLIDTYDKHHTWLGSELRPEQLRRLHVEAERQGLLFGLAGGLTLDRVHLLAQVPADVIGIRGAACTDEDRDLTIDREAVAEFRSELHRLR